MLEILLFHKCDYIEAMEIINFFAENNLFFECSLMYGI